MHLYLYNILIYYEYSSRITTTNNKKCIFLTLTWVRATILGGPPAVLARVC